VVQENSTTRVDIVGMTTTGVANYPNVLHKMKPKIIIIAKAAEILEAHIVTTLAACTQQVIMIGLIIV